MSDGLSETTFNRLCKMVWAHGSPTVKIVFRELEEDHAVARERVTALEAKCDLLSASLKQADKRAEQAESERDALRAEVERLREAVETTQVASEWVADRLSEPEAPEEYSRRSARRRYEDRLRATAEVARAALARSEPEGERR